MKLIVTNGDSAVQTIKNAGIEADVFAWDDVLHDGPVPGGKTLEELSKIRAKYISSIGWGTYEEIHQRFVERDNKLKSHSEYDELILWFEHDLYDQLQLIQILAWLADHHDPSTKLTVICEQKFIAEQNKKSIFSIFPNRAVVSPSLLNSAKLAWDVFSADTTSKIETFINESEDIFFVKKAFQFFLQEFPSTKNGSTRTEQTALEFLMDQPEKIGQIFRLHSKEMNRWQYLGDASFALYITRISNVEHPLIIFEDGTEINFHPLHSTMENFWNRTVKITEVGKQVLAGTADFVNLNGIDRWIGGIHLTNNCQYRYDSENNKIVKN